MSKMTVPNENENGPTEYNYIRFVEFLEMIARAADVKFKGNVEEHTLTLEQKIY